jgi:hypothetical protein
MRIRHSETDSMFSVEEGGRLSLVKMFLAGKSRLSFKYQNRVTADRSNKLGIQGQKTRKQKAKRLSGFSKEQSKGDP